MPAPAKVVGKLPLRYPGLPSPPVYKSFLDLVLKNRANSKHFALTDKATFDAEYEQRLRKYFANDDVRYERFMAEVGFDFTLYCVPILVD